mmetsp:Transcript_2376/g.4837  ORF Transcript_2376/g.4837 Transcript_2376/m.4837 type:complete len:670 (-) Transcript_2376:428-2437(-)
MGRFHGGGHALLIALMMTASAVHAEMDVPVKVGGRELTFHVEDGVDLDVAVKQMSDKFKELLPQEMARITQENTLEVPVQISGEVVTLRITKGQDVQKKVEEFCQAYGLEDTSGITKEVMMRAASRGFVPLLTLPIQLNDKTGIEFPVYIGQNVRAAAAEFLQSHGVQPTQEIVSRVEKEVENRMVANRLQPLSKFVFKTSDEKDLPFNVFVGDNITQIVDAFIAQHQLPADSKLSIMDHVVQSMKAEGLMPLSEFPIIVDGVQRLLPLFTGETVPQAVDKFIRVHGIDPSAAEKLREGVRMRAEEEGVSPIAAYAVKVRDQEVTLPLFKGSKVTDAVANFGKKHGLTEQDVQTLQKDVQKNLQQRGLAPLVEFKFDIGGRQAVLPLFTGQNVTDMVTKFGEAYGIGSQALDEIFVEVNRVLRAQGLAPVAEFSISWGGKLLTLTVLEGEDLRQVVAKFAQANGIPSENAPEILRQVSAKLVADGQLPVASLPVTVGDQKLTLSIFKDQTPAQAAAKFCQDVGLDASVAATLEAGLTKRLKDSGVVPMTEFSIGFGDKQLQLPLYAGQNIPDAVRIFVEKHSIPATAVEGLVKEVTRRATAQGIVPVAGIPISVRGTEHTLQIYVGQDVGEQVEAFGRKHQIAAGDMPALLQAVKKVLDDLSKQAEPQP